jgi:hypothetical protein
MEVCVCLSVSLFLCPRLCLRLCLCLGCLGFYLVLYVSFSISVSPPPVGFSAKILHLGTSPRYSTYCTLPWCITGYLAMVSRAQVLTQRPVSTSSGNAARWGDPPRCALSRSLSLSLSLLPSPLVKCGTCRRGEVKWRCVSVSPCRCFSAPASASVFVFVWVV